jgi:Spy/CpxP family protein refolding chaperone
MWTKKWFKRGIFLALIPLTAAACHHRGHAGATDEEITERLEDGTEDVMDFVDASEEQTTKVKGIVSAAAKDVKPFREEHKTLRNEFQQALSAPNVDRDQLEGLRVNALDLADRASARLLSAVADIAETLTVDQRQKLISRWKRHQH